MFLVYRQPWIPGAHVGLACEVGVKVVSLSHQLSSSSG